MLIPRLYAAKLIRTLRRPGLRASERTFRSPRPRTAGVDNASERFEIRTPQQQRHTGRRTGCFELNDLGAAPSE